ncbi:hypothetical protein I302_102427 [Kwoniella bestiolae CBS 10118]|uniref:Protein FRA10AC1 n=1 Tax=Kwoniella bestiolae CBS 10118 TaxID=1296100 RepID=A0A1B9GF29_9TREE|nr:hypothetical protein I302_01118 [Kwoniella bestiolae CBS 10118]OCF29609.1 hypothetical protein I302_01118 [Kwoniella bestiolae CBS 10118]
MSWKSAGQLISGPPSASLPTSSSSSTEPVYKRLRPNSHVSSAFQRDTAHLSHYGANPDLVSAELKSRKSDWDVVKENHRLIRDDEEPQNVSWEERVARAYESRLFKEFALIDLKHYKSHAFALRWRTAPEVINGTGEDTCASLRCKYHQPRTIPSQEKRGREISISNLRFKDPDAASSTHPPSSRIDRGDEGEEEGDVREIPPLRSYELPFVYLESGERKEALVKVRLCGRCERKLKWRGEEKHRKSKDKDGHRHRDADRGKERDRDGRGSKLRKGDDERRGKEVSSTDPSGEEGEGIEYRSGDKKGDQGRHSSTRHRSRSRSRSPSRRNDSSRHHESSRHRR